MAPEVSGAFLSREYAGIPMWGWIIGGVAGLYGVTKLRGSGGTPAPTGRVANQNGDGPGNIFFLPNAPNPIQVNLPGGTRGDANTGREEIPLDKLNQLRKPGQPVLSIRALQGESWKDVTARAYGFGKDYASVTDPAARARIDSVSEFIRNFNNRPGSSGDGPGAGSTVYFD
ncbi:hypothetical protein ACFWY9_30550 [Amycolatopsis sp. NPDC059027]|uniref:hypothetical protein n=1 Tax=Amycolatopsis sp. NPDC059027 TaxID=3346709 RepID=UPI00367357C7